MTAARSLEVVDLPHGRCVGTHHLPAQPRSRVGLLWVNFGYVPRDGHGGLATQASDALAATGVPCFRYDLPGLGDAPGPLPAVTHDFFPVVTGGHFTHVTAELVESLCTREGLDGLVVAGLCGGAVNAIFTAEALPARVKGLILLEPELYVTEPKAADGTVRPKRLRPWLRQQLPSDGGVAVQAIDAALSLRLPMEDVVKKALTRALPAQLFNYWGWMRLLTAEGRYSRLVPIPRQALLDFVMSRSGLPDVTNLPLAAAWKRWVEDGHPAVVITAKGKLRELFFDRINTALAVPLTSPRYLHVRLAGTNHIFTTGGAIASVTRHLVEAWKRFE
ncbi:MAG: alpha/beta hydrolase [Myxococcaceae bacterium]|nr:alpha/beta hydrolase [Myxococcaceae bacterium]